MKALRIITAQGFGPNTRICDIKEVRVTTETMTTQSGYIQRTIGGYIIEAIQEVDEGAVDQLWLEVVK